MATINWDNAVGSGAVANIPPPYSFSNAYRHKTTYSEVWLFDVQKQFGQNWQLQAGYLGSKSDHLYGFRNANYSVPFGLLGADGYNANGSPKSILQRTPYPNYGVIQLVHDIGNANYNAFTFQVNKRFSNGFNLISSYTYAKSLDDTSGIRTQSSQLFPQNDLCISCEYGPSDFDVKHRVVAGLIYSLPIGPGLLYAPSSKIVEAVIGGWQINVLGTLQTGLPFNMGYNDNNCQYQYHFRRHIGDPAELCLRTELFPVPQNGRKQRPMGESRGLPGAGPGFPRKHEPQHAIRPGLPTIRYVPR